jgi:hypothetical protein
MPRLIAGKANRLALARPAAPTLLPVPVQHHVLLLALTDRQGQKRAFKGAAQLQLVPACPALPAPALMAVQFNVVEHLPVPKLGA